MRRHPMEPSRRGSGLWSRRIREPGSRAMQAGVRRSGGGAWGRYSCLFAEAWGQPVRSNRGDFGMRGAPDSAGLGGSGLGDGNGEGLDGVLCLGLGCRPQEKRKLRSWVVSSGGQSVGSGRAGSEPRRGCCGSGVGRFPGGSGGSGGRRWWRIRVGGPRRRRSPGEGLGSRWHLRVRVSSVGWSCE